MLKIISGLVVKPGSWFDRTILKTYQNDLKQKGFFSTSGTSADQDRDMTSMPRIIWLAMKPRIEMRLTETELNDMKNEWGSALGISVGNILFKNIANVQKYQVKVMSDFENEINARIVAKAMKKVGIEVSSDEIPNSDAEAEMVSDSQLREMKTFMRDLAMPTVEKEEEVSISSDSQSFDGPRITYSTFVAGSWQPRVTAGQKSGTEGRSLPMQQISISLENAPAGSHIVYQV